MVFEISAFKKNNEFFKGSIWGTLGVLDLKLATYFSSNNIGNFTFNIKINQGPLYTFVKYSKNILILFYCLDLGMNHPTGSEVTKIKKSHILPPPFSNIPFLFFGFLCCPVCILYKKKERGGFQNLCPPFLRHVGIPRF